ncbi:MAG: hypothetical protein JO043_01795 [Candidatus Eremiobacteraeota bacterium]|nr:hypothetical protein [Candidatus Eremiobacteraeota bacterium]
MSYCRAVAGSALVAVVSYGCNGGGTTTLPSFGTPPKPPVKASLRIIGVGDSLTAGVQSDGLLGVDAPNPIPMSPFPVAFRTQENGFWALLWQQANPQYSISDPSTSPLPLIAAPGVGTLLVPGANNAPTPIVTACAQSNLNAYAFRSALSTRLNANVSPYDVGIPGQTVHEAIFQFQPTGPCNPPPGPTGALAPLLMENAYFYPVLGTWGPSITQLNAAASLHGQIATVWLGSNDVLKAAFSGGAIGPTDTASVRADLTTIVQTLQKSGAKVAVANLVDILGAAFFFPGPTFAQSLATLLEHANPPVPVPIANFLGQLYAGQVAKLYGIGPNGGYVTLQGVAIVTAAIQAHANLGTPPYVLVPQGDFVTAALASKLHSANLAYNSAIANVAHTNGAALVDVYTLFVNAEKNGYRINPPVCCTLQFGGGFFSLDGLHPSNTGYAVLANLFITTIDNAFGTSIPQVDVASIYKTDPYAPH